jgi:hypothetical protein
MKTAIFLLLFFCLSFACEGKQDIYLLKTDSGFRILLTNRGDKGYTVSMFNSEYPQYAKNPKKIFRFENIDENSAINKLKENNLYDFMSDYPADFKWIRRLVVIEI